MRGGKLRIKLAVRMTCGLKMRTTAAAAAAAAAPAAAVTHAWQCR